MVEERADVLVETGPSGIDTAILLLLDPESWRVRTIESTGKEPVHHLPARRTVKGQAEEEQLCG